jgi:transposase
MATKRRKKTEDLPVLHPDAAGIDVGASELFVAVSADRDPEPVRSYPTFTRDLHELGDWLQSCGIRSVGLLRASFRPPGVICAIRSLWRRRESLIEMAAEHVLHIQKALEQMNLQIHRVLNDITGLSGQRILDAILARNRVWPEIQPGSQQERS